MASISHAIRRSFHTARFLPLATAFNAEAPCGSQSISKANLRTELALLEPKWLPVPVPVQYATRETTMTMTMTTTTTTPITTTTMYAVRNSSPRFVSHTHHDNTKYW